MTRTLAALTLTAALTLALSACDPGGSLTDPAPAGSASGSSAASVGGAVSAASAGGGLVVGGDTVPVPAPGTCHLGRSASGQPLPDRSCTPGAVNPTVTAATLGRTICSSGWTRTVRPPASVTDRMKVASARAYAIPRSVRGEYDHLVPLELGGAPIDSRNLWFEPGHIPNPKDAVENALNSAVCAHLVPLATAQRAIATNWVNAFTVAGLRVSGGRVCLAADPARCATDRHRGSGS